MNESDLDALRRLAERVRPDGPFTLEDQLDAAFDVCEQLPALLAALERAQRLDSWDGLMAILDEHYPASLFGESGPFAADPGARIVTLTRALDGERRRAERVEAATRKAIDRIDELQACHRDREVMSAPCAGQPTVAVFAARDALRTALAAAPGEECG